MNVIWLSSPQAKKNSALAALLIGLLVLILSPFIPELIVILMTALILILSVLLTITGISLRGTGLSVFMVLLGIAGCILSGYILLSPDMGVSLLGILLGIWIILLGGTQLAYAPAVSQDKWNYVFMLGAGIVSILVGIYLLISPVQGLQVITIFIGCYLVAYGIVTYFKSRPKNQMDAEFTVKN